MYIEYITDQSNWSAPFSLVVVCSLYNLGVVSSIPGRGTWQNFFLQMFLLLPSLVAYFSLTLMHDLYLFMDSCLLIDSFLGFAEDCNKADQLFQ